MKKGKAIIVVGAQWGDEGKGKLSRFAGVSDPSAARGSGSPQAKS